MRIVCSLEESTVLQFTDRQTGGSGRKLKKYAGPSKAVTHTVSHRELDEGVVVNGARQSEVEGKSLLLSLG